MIKFTDAVALEKVRRTDDGYLVSVAKVARTGIQLYSGAEVGNADMDVVRVYRPPEEVFADAALQGYSHAPMTNDHPAEAVTADNWKQLAIGEVSTAARRDGDWVSLPLIMKDSEAIAAYEAGKQELSAGYMSTLDWTPGVTADGQPYDAVQRDIRINHLALVDKARAGSQARIGDGVGNWGTAPLSIEDQPQEKPNMADKLRTVLHDGVSIEVTDQGAQVIEKLQKQLSDSHKSIEDLKAEQQKAMSDKDKELGEKDAEIEKLKDSQIDPAKLDQMAADRAEVVAAAKKLADSIDTKGLSDADIRRAAVAAKLGDAKVKDKNDDYVSGLFDHLTSEQRDRNPLSDGIQHSKPTHTNDAWGEDVYASAGVAVKKGA